MSFTSAIIQKVVVGALSTAVVGGSVGLLNIHSRVAVLESQRTDDVSRLERIENKVDKLLERSSVASNGK